MIHIPSWLSRWLTRFVLTTAHNCYIQNVHYETLIVCKNDVYKIPEVLFISLTLNWHFRKKKINQYVPHI